MKADWCNKGVAVPWKGQDHFTSLLIWLSKNIDERDWDWDVPYDKDEYYRVYYFAHERDANWFALRWL